MNKHHKIDRIASLVLGLCKLPQETEWVEYKVNKSKPEEIGENISALANVAALHGKSRGYMVWGIKNGSQEIAGTKFSPFTAKKGNEPLETWLYQRLDPAINFQFYETSIDNKKLVLLEVFPAANCPVAFSQVRYIRVGSSTRKLNDFPEKERILWSVFADVPFEKMVISEHESGDSILNMIDYPSYFVLLNLPIPERSTVRESFQQEGLIQRSETGGWNLTNLGGILLARKLSDFQKLGRKALRVIRYEGSGRRGSAREKVFDIGYASGFERMMEYIDGQLPIREYIDFARRKTERMYPIEAVRELVANALIHQDFSITGSGPMVEIFDERIEITNPGNSLVDAQRFLDASPKSHNENLASLMSRFDFCEERGSGINKVIELVEFHQLPAPRFETTPNYIRVTLYGPRPLADMSNSERIQACYLHASLKYIEGGELTTSSLRERFGVAEKNKATISRCIGEAVEAELIKPFDESSSRKFMSYVPFWA